MAWNRFLKAAFLSVLLTLSACSTAPVQPTPRIAVTEAPIHEIARDYLAFQHPKFQIINASGLFKEGSSGGHLDWTFGTGTKKFEDYLAKVHPKFWRIHLLNTTCVRNNVCGTYEPVYGYSVNSLDLAIRQKQPKLINHVRDRTLLYKEIASRFPETKFLLSPALEHNLSDEAWRVLANTVKEAWPRVQLVNNPMNATGERYRGAWMEGHGNKPRMDAEVVSLDGTDATDIDIVAYRRDYRHTILQYIWSRSDNCRNQGPWQDPRARTSCPYTYQFEELYHIMDIRGEQPELWPNVCKRVETFSAPKINKPFAEDKGTNDIRANKPVIITQFNTKTLSAIDFRGNEIGTVGLYGPYQNGLSRHYSAWNGGSRINGFEFEKRAVEKSGYPWLWLKSGQSCVGPIILGRRAGAMR